MDPLRRENIVLAPEVHTLDWADSRSLGESGHHLADQVELDNLPGCNFGLPDILHLVEGGRY